MTYQQVVLFYESIGRMRLREARFQASVLFRVINAAVAGKKEAIEDLLRNMDEEYTSDVNRQLDEAKKMGLPIEDK